MTEAPASAHVVLLGAAPAVRGRTPAALAGVADGTRVLDWLLAAFAEIGAHPTMVVGYQAADVVAAYPDLDVVVNEQWQTTGPLHSFGLVDPPVESTVFAAYADVVFRPATVKHLHEATGDVVIAIDSTWRHRYDGRSRAALRKAEKVRHSTTTVERVASDLALGETTAEFVGAVRFSSTSWPIVRAALQQGTFDSRAGLPELLQHCIDAGLVVTAIDVQGDWAELDARQDLARFVLGTKAESLERLRAMAHGGSIGEQVTFTQEEWDTDPERVTANIIDQFGTDQLIVRSSALSEDNWNESGAGRHESMLDVAPNPTALHAAITAVLASYGEADPCNQVLVQRMLHDVRVSGVCMTRTHAHGAPYYVMNFDDTTRRTDTVTAGQDARTVIAHRDSDIGAVEPVLAAVLQVVRNSERLIGHDALDIEFAVTGDEMVHVLQVRPIAIEHLTHPVDDLVVADAVRSITQYLSEEPKNPNVFGSGHHLSVMTDWNPAEIIGTKPRPLAFSLYRRLITDEIWARQRAEYGYRDVRPSPLLVDVVGHPYVDVRASFTSFVPATLDPSLARQLVEHYLTTLRNVPELHDKVEFDIVFTCLTPDFEARAQRLRDAGFTDADIAELRRALREVTQFAIDSTAAFSRSMRAAQAAHDTATHAQVAEPLQRAFLYLHDAANDETLVFAHLARSAFVTTDLLRGLVAQGAITPERQAEFLASIETVFGRLQHDAALVRRGDRTLDDLARTYGHLRPGTYDITSPTYADMPELYLAPVVESATADIAGHDFAWTATERLAIEHAFDSLELEVTCDAFTDMARAAISGREEAKFVFTQSLSAALDAIAEWGEGLGLDRDAVSMLHIHEIEACREVLEDTEAFVNACVDRARSRHALVQSLNLPGQLSDPRSASTYEQPNSVGNFVTQRTAEAAIVTIADDPYAEVEGAIVLIPSADPGYDGLLARGIAGLVTMYGGANSHMAVRAAETGIPAAIGIGERRFNELARAHVIRLECANRRIVVIS